jgi:putative membrane protein
MLVYVTRSNHFMTTSMMRIAPVLLTAGLFLSAAPADTSLNSKDLDFVNGSAQAGNTEVELGRLAAQKSTNPLVQGFANRMISDHSKIDLRLTALATSKGVKLPTGKGLENDARYVELKVLSGKEFDNAYVKAMVIDHKEDVSSFQKEREDAQDSDVKTFAAKTLPMLQDHLARIEKIKAEMDSK